ncbi:hypothetical protein KC330_g6295 [Hortaea werneckii]|nr:hypothetical protein KC330_g6295 [Hortaea werneckii]
MPANREVEKDGQPRACDACRARKVRCDKGSPCSHCKSGGSICRTTVNTNAEPRSRVNISKEYEKKIDRIGDRLANIEALLTRKPKSAADTPAEGAYGNDQANALSNGQTPGSEASTRVPTPGYTLHDATTGVHSAVASKLIEQAVGDSPAAFLNSELAAALQSLKEMVGKIEDKPDSTDKVQAHWSWRETEPVASPTLPEIDKLLSSARGSMTMQLSPGLTEDVFRKKCASVFADSKPASAIRRLYVYGCLWSLCTELSGTLGDPAFAKRCQGLARLFSHLVEETVGDLKLIIPASEEAASALALGAGLATELCKPYVALRLSQAAASMVITLGYHRFSTMHADSDQERHGKIMLFWMCYWLDTSFAVRLGHAPVIRDYDITVPPLQYGKGIDSPFVEAFNYWTTISRLQCQVVEQLYSPLAQRQPLQERSRRAACLARELQVTWSEREEAFVASMRETENSGMFYLWKESDAVYYYSTLALVQHATISAQDVESPALESARRALRLNVDARIAYRDQPDFVWSGHCHWTLLKAPITPFIVTFCHITAHPFSTKDDLQLLADFVATLKELCRFSDGMAKLHKLCDVFCKVADLYVRAKALEATQVNNTMSYNNAGNASAVPDWMGQPAVNDIDDYLSTIGFAPPATMPLNGYSDASLQTTQFDPSYLTGWYAGSSSIMGLLEQDMPFPDVANAGQWPGSVG